MNFSIGDRVLHKNEGGVGHIEAIDDDPEYPIVDVRWLTPKNEPSVLISACLPENLIKVSDNVVPVPKSKQWWAQANAFYSQILHALEEMDLK